jgi:hypothetical protein
MTRESDQPLGHGAIALLALAFGRVRQAVLTSMNSPLGSGINGTAFHVASASKTPSVVLFESRYFRLNSQEWSPYRVPNAVLRKPRSEDPGALRESRTKIVEAVASLL